MTTSILNSIIQAPQFGEHSVLEAIVKYPELLNSDYWQAMDDWRHQQEGEYYNRALFLLKLLSRVSKIQDQIENENLLLKIKREDSLIHIKAGNAFLNTDQTPNAIVEYLKALQVAINNKDHEIVKNLLLQLINLISEFNLKSAHAILSKLSGNAFALEAFRSSVLNELQHQLFKGILRVYMDNQPVNTTALLFLLQHLKGFAYGAMLKLPTELPDPNSLGVELLKKIQYIKDQQETTQLDEIVSAIDEETLMSAYLGEKEKLEENSLETKVKNLQIDFDRWLNNYILQDIENGDYPLLFLKDVQDAIGKDTVLCIQFMAGDAFGKAANYFLLITKEDVKANYAIDENMPAGNVEISSEGITTNTATLAFNVPDVRKEIQDTPYGYENCTAKGLQLLAEDSEMLLAPIVPYLDAYKLAGKTHLMMQPHGAYHYYPFHLLPYKDGLLCDEWLVTSLPNLHLLTSKKNNSTQNIEFVDMASFGLGYSEASKLNIPPLSNAITEAEEVAELFQSKALTDKNGNATEDNFIEAFSVAKRIHLCAHGNLNVTAPAFQSVLLISSRPNGDGLPAWQLMDLNAENVDLLTLSVCETALGRFDVMDNLQGMPAAFLKAGVSTIIGSLWEAETLTCETFFISFYKAIKEGKSKKESFQIAQRHTRKKHPVYRDWGNFFYLGAVD